MPDASTPSDQTDTFSLHHGVYLASWILFFVAGGLGTMLHMALALEGPGITYFGLRVGTGANVCWALGFFGFVAWLQTRRKVQETRWQIAGMGLVVLTSAVLGVAWRYPLGFSWQYACADGDAYACESLGDLAGALGDEDWRRMAHRAGCLRGSADSCRWLLDNDVSLENGETACHHLARRCAIWKRCRDGEPVDGVDCDRPTYTDARVGEEMHCDHHERYCQSDGDS